MAEILDDHYSVNFYISKLVRVYQVKVGEHSNHEL